MLSIQCGLLLFILFHLGHSVRLIVSPDLNPVQRPVGDDVQLMCRIEGSDDEKAGLVWTKYGGIDKTGNVEVKKLDAFNVVLLIKNGSATDGGVYTCTATVHEATLKADVDIIFFSELRFLESNSHVSSIMATASVNMSCTVVLSEGEKVKTTWYRYGQPIPAKAEKFALFKGGAILEVKNYDPASDPGEYMCKVENAHTGNAVTRTITLGGLVETRRAFCNNMCQNVCYGMFKAFP